ncbi:MAG TPA: GDP-mannose 4,6-dehydratase [Thermoanaerobaculia bacterium]|nr:GDP-mannose 4,6-dehydratase [Thermoanaerobaculia bacterium]
MRYLITGGCGFVGTNVAARLIKQGDDVIVVDNLFRHGSAPNLEWLSTVGKFRWLYADTRNANDVERVVASVRPDAIFHLAGQVAMTTSIADPRLDFETNVVGTINVLEAVRKHAPECAIVYSSSNKVYGDLVRYEYEEGDSRYNCIDRPAGFDEDTPLEFHSPYGCSKGAADQYLLDYARIFGLKTVVFRHSSIYGGRQFSTFDQGWVGWFCTQAIEQRDGDPGRFTISGNGKQVRDVLYASDAVDCYLSAVENIEQAKGQAFNIGGGIDNSLSLLELFALLEELLSVKLRYDVNPPRESDQLFFVADITKASRILSFRPRVSAREGIEKTVEWLVSNQQTSGRI